MVQLKPLLRAFTLTVLLIAPLACSNRNPTPDTKPEETTSEANHGQHRHKPTSHQGNIVKIGSGSHHLEVIFDKSGELRLYTLGRDDAHVIEVETQTLTAYAKLDGSTDSQAFNLEPKPQRGDQTGKTSLFVGQLPKELIGKAVSVTIPSMLIGAERFRVAFESKSETAHADMPTKVADSEERKLFQTPGGKYAEADIKANGNVLPSQKFKGFKATHDVKPQAGDKLCPISMTKANPRFTWVVDGKTYEFCCPPCLDEFVALAKEKPGEIKPPEAYIQK